MGITGLLPFIEKASRRVNIGEFSGCTVAIDSYCWLHKGAFACADKLVRGEETNVHINYCMKYVDMLLEKNVKPILVFDGRHLPAKAMTESKRRESRNASKKRAAELLRLGKMEEARSYMRRSVDITHEMALALIKECRNRNIDCIVAPYEADAQLAYLNIRNIAHIVITEDSDLILFGCTKVLFKMDLCGFGTLVETEHLPLVMKCPIEHYTFNKFRQMCIMSGCDYLASLPGIGLAKARQFVTATQDTNFANALRKLPGFFNRANLTVTDEYRENFLKAEATFKHQYVYDPIERKMVRLTEPDNEDIEQALCVNAGEMLDPKVAFQLALGNLDPFTLNKMDDWHPDHRPQDTRIKTNKWKEKGTSNHSSIWSEEFTKYLADPCPWQKKVKKLDPFVGITRGKTRKVVNLVSKCVPETQDDSLSIETLSNMYCLEPLSKRKKIDDQNDDQNEDQNDDAETTIGLTTDETVPRKTSPILENKQRSFKKILNNGSYSVLKRLSKFPRTVIDENVVESKFFSSTEQKSTEFTSEVKEQKIPEHSRNPFKVSTDVDSGIDTQTEFESKFESNSKFELNCKSELDLTDCESQIEDSQKENSMKKSINPIVNGSPMKKSTSPIVNGSPIKKRISPILEASPRNPFKRIERTVLSQDSVIENTEEYSYPSSSQESSSRPTLHNPSFYKRTPSQTLHSSQPNKQLNGVKRSTCRVPGLKRTTSLPSNQPTLLSKFGFQKKPVLKM